MSIKLDLHVHSESHGRTFINADQLRESLRLNNLDGVAITNFFGISHALQLKEEIREYIIIVGQEVWTRSGHIIGLGLKERIPDYLSAEQSIDLIHQQGGIAIAAHPYLYLGVGTKVMGLPVDAIEVYNGIIGGFFIYNYLAKRLAQKMNAVQLASTDTTSASLVGHSYTEVMTDDSNLILEAICSGKVRLIKRPAPIPFVFIIRNILKFHNLEPWPAHAIPCFICGRSMTVRLFKEKFECLDCGKTEMSRIACCNGHYICKECIVTNRPKKRDGDLRHANNLKAQEIER